MNLLQTIRASSTNILVLGYQPAIIQSILDFDFLSGRPASIVGIVASNRKAAKFFWGEKEMLIPCFASINAVRSNQDVSWMLNLQSGRRALESTEAFFAAYPEALGGHIFAENVPEQHATKLIAKFSPHKLLIGPSGVGLLIPGALKLGAIGGISPEQIKEGKLCLPGNIAVGSTSGGMTNELIHAVARANHHLSFAACVGGDRFPTLSLTRLLELAQSDPATQAFVYFGELGGVDEYEMIELIKNKQFTKPLTAYIAGVIDEAFDDHVQFGHAKALVRTQNESARAKREALRAVGATVPETFPEFLTALQTLPTSTIDDGPSPLQTTSFMNRQKSILTTRKIAQPDKLGNGFVQNTLEALLGRPITSEATKQLVETVFTLLIDHGGHVSGAVNTMITARAGKDLVSSLAAGLLTIGPRFGGAVNTAAATWFEAVSDTQLAANLVERENKAGRLIAGIGHKKYRLGLPDPRVAALSELANKLNTHPHLDFAREVEKVTTSKNGSLILNVDGMIAAVLLDVLQNEEGLTSTELKELIDAEFFNAFFIIPRTVGFIGHFLEQKKNDEGLFRLPDDLLFERD